jgi:MFS superfamily sulfate permease-like transporter
MMKLFKTFTVHPFIMKDASASFVVFLVAVPLSMGIAIASGLPPVSGLVTGIMGGIIVGAISGAPLQVSGPAAGLTITVAEIIHTYGIELFGPIILLAGLFQVCAGVFKIGKIFQTISPAVIYGMLAGIGVLILGSQFHVMLMLKPLATGLGNFVDIPLAIGQTFNNQSQLLSAAIGVNTLITIFVWEKIKPRTLQLIPGSLVGVIVGAGLANFMHLPIAYVDVPRNLMQVIRFPDFEQFGRLLHPAIPIASFTIAFIASAESLLSAVAVDRLHQGKKTNFDIELIAQGLGNMACGLLGILPVTGVIARSSVNVKAGAKTRLSTILHGIWILAFLVAAPNLLKMIPLSSLAAILVVAGYELIEFKHIFQLRNYGKMPVVIFCGTFMGILVIDLLTGVVIGVLLTMATYPICILCWRKTKKISSLIFP